MAADLIGQWRDVLPPALFVKHAITFVDEELTPDLLASMADVTAALKELGLDDADGEAVKSALLSGAKKAAAPTPPPLTALRSPPKGWPTTASAATPFISKALKGTKVRQVGEISAQHLAPLVGLSLRADDAKSNALRVRDRMGWTVLGGFALTERADCDDDDDDDDGSAASSSSDGGGVLLGKRYVGLPHYWNVTPRGLWVDPTPRPHPHLASLILVESSALLPPPPPQYAAKSTNPMIIRCVEGLCNRLRAVLSYRLVAHEAGRPLICIWQKDAYCPGHFIDLFLPIPGVKFVKQPPEGKSSADIHIADDTHPSIKGTPSEGYAYACLHPNDALKKVISEEIKRCGPSYYAIHVRRTDLYTALSPSEHTSDEEFESFADRSVGLSIGGGKRLYVATDNGETQARFLTRYDEGVCVVHKKIENKQGALRQTGLAEAVVDIFVCAAATNGFMGSYYSSFSDAIRHIRSLQGKSNKADVFRLEAKKTKKVEPQTAKEEWLSPPPTMNNAARPARPPPTVPPVSAEYESPLVPTYTNVLELD